MGCFIFIHNKITLFQNSIFVLFCFFLFQTLTVDALNAGPNALMTETLELWGKLYLLKKETQHC